MAGFQKVMKQWRRFCKSHSNCGECEFDGKDICGQAHLSDVPYSDMELRIMAWAAEHPEPVYPTFFDWIKSMMGDDWELLASDHDFVAWMTHTRIPTDAAQKLGIEPKEGT